MLRAVIRGTAAGCCRFDDGLVHKDSKKRHLLPKNPKTVIAVLFPYYTGELNGRNTARYACLDNYHKIAGEILAGMSTDLKLQYPGEEFVSFVNSSPIREVVAAHRCGLGVIGRHGMLIHDLYGSMVFIGAIVTSLALTHDMPKPESCPLCGRCSAACPTGALSDTAAFDKTRCLSYITQKKGVLTDWERGSLKAGGMVVGCDICMDACPLNRDAPLTEIDAFYKNITPVLSLENIDALIAEKPYGWRGKDVLIRNLMILEE
ncbi:MAG: 4Fe-4S binding protein [Oscillospiraceae bacterium]|nr:4Fe-4S binding protein [Oscillospiraceae bacterium]